MGNTRVLLVEDDQRLGALQHDFLIQQGLDVRWLRDGLDAEHQIFEFKPDVVILDLMLPGVSGLDVCRKIRPVYNGFILFLTSSDDDIDHVACLELGADDFIVKPIRPRVLLARIHMLLRNRRRSPESTLLEQKDTLSYGRLLLKKKSRVTSIDNIPIKLTASEFNLLWILASHPDEVMERAELFRELRGIEFDGMDRSVDTKIVSLRKKLSDIDEMPRKIITVRNKGYLFSSDAWG